MTSGELVPLKDTSFVWTPTKVGTIQTIWRYQGQYWFHWLEVVDVVESPLANDAFGRVYWTGEAEPRMTTSSIATAGGGTNYPNNYYILGVPAPAADATQNAGTPSDANNIQSRAYIYTYVTGSGEEGPNTDPSDLFDITDGDSVTVTLPSTGPTGAYNITHKNIYRLNNGVYQFLAQITAATTLRWLMAVLPGLPMRNYVFQNHIYPMRGRCGTGCLLLAGLSLPVPLVTVFL